MDKFRGRDIRILDILISRYITMSVREYGLGPGKYNLLMVIDEHPGITIEETGVAAQIDKGAVSRMVKRLNQMGYVSRDRDEGDRRVCRLRCTSKGEDACMRMREIRRKVNGILLDGMEEHEEKIFSERIRKMQQAVRDELGLEDSRDITI